MAGNIRKNYYAMKTLAIILLALAPAIAHAQQIEPRLMRPKGTVNALPPPEYRNYAGKFTVERVETPEQVKTLCNLKQTALACTYPPTKYDMPCRIIIASKEFIAATGYTDKIVMQHELGHCAGWPSNHPNQQPAP